MKMKITNRQTGKREIINITFDIRGRSPGDAIPTPWIPSFNKKFKISEWSPLRAQIIEGSPMEISLFYRWLEEKAANLKGGEK